MGLYGLCSCGRKAAINLNLNYIQRDTSVMPVLSEVAHLSLIDDLRKSKGLHSVSAYRHGAVYIGPCLRV